LSGTLFGRQAGEDVSMGSEESADAVRRWFEAFNAGDMEAERAARTEDFVAHAPGMPMPLDGDDWEQFIGMFFGGFPDMRLEVQDIVAQGDRVAVRWVFHGTHDGEFFGIPPTGTRVTMNAIEINRVQDGKVAEHWVELDQLGMLQQLGAIPSPH
jgi:steroid delta-isomerase-like uncharacterized protein